MTKTRLIAAYAVVVVLIVWSAAATAEENPIKGVYLGSRELCADAKKSLQKVIEAGNVVLTNRGLEATEYNCSFLQMLKNPDMPAGWVATAMCEEPDYAYPDLFSIVERTAGQLEVAAMSELNDQQGTSDDGTGDDQPSERAAPAKPGAQAEDEVPDSGADASADDDSAGGVSGTYYRCSGVFMP